MAQMNLSTIQKHSHQSTENRLVVATAEGEGATGCLGLVDTNYYIENG